MKNDLFKKSVITENQSSEVVGGAGHGTIGEKETRYQTLWIFLHEDRQFYTD